MPLNLKRWRYADFLLILILLLLLAYGLALVYSSTFPSTNSESIAFSGFVKKQMAYAVGLGANFCPIPQSKWRITSTSTGARSSDWSRTDKSRS